ncbi:MAG TPA: magnesium transporter CorA family protein [Acidimicrobiia bacterium]
MFRVFHKPHYRVRPGLASIIDLVIRSFTWVHGQSLPSAETTGTIPEIPDDGWVWLDLSAESPETVEETCRSFGIPERFIADTLAEGSLPLLEEQRELIYVVLNVFRTTSTGRLGPSEVDLFIGPEFVLSIHDKDIPSVDTVMDRLERGVGLTAASPAGLVAHLAMVGSRRYPELIDHVEAQLDSLEELAMGADPRAINEVYALRRDVIVLRRVVVPQRQIYDELAEGGHQLLDESSRKEFERVAGYQTQILESLDAARSLLGSVLETYRGAIADQTNEIVRVLTVFSAILLPLTLISGIFGMNFVEIPLAKNPLGFWITVGAMAIGAIALWIYFGRRRFVGTPRLRDLPKAVGLGIFSIGTAPIRVVAGGIRSLGKTDEG